MRFSPKWVTAKPSQHCHSRTLVAGIQCPISVIERIPSNLRPRILWTDAAGSSDMATHVREIVTDYTIVGGRKKNIINSARNDGGGQLSISATFLHVSNVP